MAETANRKRTTPAAPEERRQPPEDNKERCFVIHLSLLSLILSLAAAVSVAFGLGRLARFSSQQQHQQQQQQQQQHQQQQQQHSPILPAALISTNNNNNNNSPPFTLPSPVLPAGRKMPHATYSGHHFDTPGVTSRISDVLLDDSSSSSTIQQQRQQTAFQIMPEGTIQAMIDRDDDDDDDADGEEEPEEIHQPRGQHLLVDIKNVDGAFLNSEERLASAMLNLTKQSELTLLSYHCHGLEPMGVTCVGVLLESHVSFHTWPIPGVITLDLFTCGPKSLIPLISVIEELFAIPQKSNNDTSSISPPRLIWSHKNRGFDFGGVPSNPENVEHQVFLLGWKEYDMKKRIAMEKTALQTFQVYDVIDTRFNNIETYEKSLQQQSNDGGGSYESQNPQFFAPERILYLDDVMQSRRHGLEAYHEALVHPAMLAHPHPQRVAIIGGGEGATLREVLKHKTVVTAVMIEIDGAMVNASRKYLPEWSDCSDLVGSTDSCFDDARAEVYFEDASGWFLSRFADKDKINEADKFDVIIMDALYVKLSCGYAFCTICLHLILSCTIVSLG
jgi:S-adenosylmethionine decarboxylase proenzyme